MKTELLHLASAEITHFNFFKTCDMVTFAIYELTQIIQKITILRNFWIATETEIAHLHKLEITSV